MLPIAAGIGETATIRIANHLGAGRVGQAQLATAISLLISFLAACASSYLIYTMREGFAEMFSNDV